MNEADYGGQGLKEVFNRLESYMDPIDQHSDNKISQEASPQFQQEYANFLMETYVRDSLQVYRDSQARTAHFDIFSSQGETSHGSEFKLKMDEEERAAWADARIRSLEEYSYSDTIRGMIFDAIDKAPLNMQPTLFRRLVSMVSQYGFGEDALEMSAAMGDHVANNRDHATQIAGYSAMIMAICEHVDNPEAFVFQRDADDAERYEDDEFYQPEAFFYVPSADAEGNNEDSPNFPQTSIDDFAQTLLDELSVFPFHFQPLIEALCTVDKKSMITFIRAFPSLAAHYADFLSIIRESIVRTPDSPLRDRLEQFGKLLIGFKENDPRPFHALLSDVYKAVDMSNYEGYTSTEKTDVRLISELAQEVEDGTIVDLGCGTGRLMHALAQTPGAIQAGTHILGVDIHVPSIEQAQKAGEALNLDNVEYRQSSFLEIGDVLEPQSISALYSLGRTVNHVDGPSEFIRLMHNVHTVLKNGGVWLFDTPNPERGKIKSNRDSIATVLMNLRIDESTRGVSFKAWATPVDYVVDSPDGENFYTRYVPQIQALLSQLRMCGFDAEVVTTSDLHGPSYDGDQTVYIRAVKQEGPTPLMRQQEPKTIEQMLFELLRGDESQPQ
jgi:2-polyprenyl-3-methyl-5-hydroxy-6-metoxy-1,4-benzoquinol methylase